MEKILRKVAQFQLIHDVVEDNYLIRNSITEQKSYRFDREKADTILILNRYEFASRCIQRAGNNLKNKV